ncbi:sugar ABC transporter ATP-binding protein [Alicyclobacillus contaminans]|uniref:sugar ABC transporter ATP-binding protein n=1 Tax=Alicyclobacillus contaminans TaxID=392016 RepID=UPI0003F9F77C|nr:sugar ABC transporter ATP-binding protein [Alicyclobacillus contaminans]
MPPTPILEVRGIRKRFPGTVALDGVDLVVQPGEIHALMGENGAGKSTLLKILTGALPRDGGDILIRGRPVHFRSPAEARAERIAIVHQELSLFPDVSVMENILGSLAPTRFGLMRKRQMLDACYKQLQRLQASIDPNERVKHLSVSQQQLVEIAKALMQDADLYIFDEPTSALSVSEAEQLFTVLRELKAHGKAIIYVSHKFDEIFSLCDTISVLRDGSLAGCGTTSTLTPDDVIRMMVGRTIEQIYPDKGVSEATELLRVEHLTAGRKCRDVSFTLRRGEILGLFGLVGSGRTEMMHALTGIAPRQRGEIFLNGKPVQVRSFRDAMSAGMYYLTEDRKGQGLFLQMSIQDNVSAVHLEALSRRGVVNESAAAQLAQRVMSDLRVKAHSERQAVGSLSGGNQQKVMIGKWLARNPKILILDEPTRGIDVGAKAEIHQLLRRLASEGIGIIVISSELPEVVGLSDRVAVVHEGSITGVLSGEDIRDDIIMEYASGLRRTPVTGGAV